jgi:hypothetical protein
MADSTIDGATLTAAERLFGIQYTNAGRTQILDNLTDQIELAVRRRAASRFSSLNKFANARFRSGSCRADPSKWPRRHHYRAMYDRPIVSVANPCWPPQLAVLCWW